VAKGHGHPLVGMKVQVAKVVEDKGVQYLWWLLVTFLVPNLRVSLVEDKSFQRIFGDYWQCLRSFTLESSCVSFFQFFCFAPCWCKFFSIRGTWKAIRVQGEKLSTILLLIVLCLGSLMLEFHSVSFFWNKICTLLLQVFFNWKHTKQQGLKGACWILTVSYWSKKFQVCFILVA
jgi:hypothetical protein